MKTAYAYIKTYAGEPADDEVVAQQLATIEQHANEQGIEIVGEYRDLNIDAELEKHCEGLYEIMLEAVNNGVSCVIVERSEGIARDSLVHAFLLAALEDHGLCVLSASDGVNLTASNNPLLSQARQVFRAYKDSRRFTINLKLRNARNRVRKKRGWCEGAKPFGHYPGEQETLDRMLQLRRKPRNKPRRTYQAIADILNDEGRPTRRGGPWMKAAVHRIVKRHESQRLHAIK